MQPQFIVIHTSGSRRYGVTAATIDRWHRARGFDGIGYHYVVLDDRRRDKSRNGEVQQGRPDDRTGAHCIGLNRRSIGICVVGDGDRVAFTGPQKMSLVHLCHRLCVEYGIYPTKIIGHREVNYLVRPGGLSRRSWTRKTCPGLANDVGEIRSMILAMRPWA